MTQMSRKEGVERLDDIGKNPLKWSRLSREGRNEATSLGDQSNAINET